MHSMIFSRSSEGGRGICPGFFVLLTVLMLPVTTRSESLGPDIHTPARDSVVLKLDGDAITATAPAIEAGDGSVHTLVQQIQALIERSRTTGSPRPLGLAQGLLAQVPQQQWTPEVFLMRAMLLQRLHRFDEAQADLSRVLQVDPNNRQAWLTRYSIALVRGNLAAASQACDQLAVDRPTLLAESCKHELASFGARPVEAFQQLQQIYTRTRAANAIERDFALVTLAEMASRLELPAAQRYWKQALLMDPKDPYRRSRYADWLLRQEQPEQVLNITEGYEHIDSLAVLRAIAMKRQGHPQRENLANLLEERFTEARWRGEPMHTWEYGRFLLDVRNEPAAALNMARENWATQRGHPDQLLLIRAAKAAGEDHLLKQIIGDTTTL